MSNTSSTEIENLRKKLIEEGKEALSVVELLALILGKLPKGNSSLAVAQDLCSFFGSIEKMLKAKKEDLLKIDGIGEEEASLLVSLFSLVDSL